MSKKCNRCHKGGLDWNKEYFEKSGKWKLMDHKKQDGEWCVKNNFVKSKESKSTKKDYTICPLCTGAYFGYCMNNEYEKHKRIHHPNNETRDDEYYQM